ncbi:MAG: hypothetical protein FD126_2313 [Elusimicrobia bacterium]|nr:MAG: hypothetical protein FD126_2313 [Elusimicrobiota bacterium]
MRVWLFSAAAFFGLVILYFLGGKLVAGRPATPAAGAPAPVWTSEPAAAALPTAPIRMKIKRIEPRKYRREGDVPSPSRG